MTIKEVSEKYDISQDTLRYYERVGLIPPVSRTAGGIRNYNESDLGWVEHAICMRSAGVPIEALSSMSDSTRWETLLLRQDARFCRSS